MTVEAPAFLNHVALSSLPPFLLQASSLSSLLLYKGLSPSWCLVWEAPYLATILVVIMSLKFWEWPESMLIVDCSALFVSKGLVDIFCESMTFPQST